MAELLALMYNLTKEMLSKDTRMKDLENSTGMNRTTAIG
jgi:hypothetical protein